MSGGSPATPLANRICAGLTIAFAVWTVCAHTVVALGGNLQQLLLSYAVAAAAAAGAARWIARGREDANGESLATEVVPRSRHVWILQPAALAIGIGLALTAADSPAGVTRLWWGGVLMLGAAALPFLLLEGPAFSTPIRGRRPELALWLIALACAVAALVVHRPDIDDSFYVNVAVAAADFPNAPLLSRDTMLGVPELPLHMPAHRIHTYELWNGALSYLTGIPAIYVFHWVSAAGFGLLVALAHAKLFRLLTPRIWPWAVAAFVLVLLGVGETHRWFGNFSLVRMWQGKAVYLYVFMPLVYAYAIEFALRPSVRLWILLCAAQAAAVGCSSSAIWAAPVGAWIALCCVTRPSAAGLRTFALGALTSVYVLAVGLTLKGDMQSLVAPGLEIFSTGDQLARALHATLGSGRLWHVGVATILAAWACCPRGLAQRFALAISLAVMLVLLNPFLDHFVRSNVTGPSYWRAMWAIPLPVLISLVLISPLNIAGEPIARRAVGVGASALLCTAFLVGVPRFSALDERNGGAAGVGIWIGKPVVKAPPEPYALAIALNDAVPSGSTVVAPAHIGLWLPTIHDHAYPLRSRRMYLMQHRSRLGDDDVALRLFMTDYVGGANRVANPHDYFARGLQQFDVKGVLLRDSLYADQARRVLGLSGFSRQVAIGEFEIWTRP